MPYRPILHFDKAAELAGRLERLAVSHPELLPRMKRIARCCQRGVAAEIETTEPSGEVSTEWQFIPYRCNDTHCPVCGPIRARRLARSYKKRLASCRRLVTFTQVDKPGESVEHAARRLGKALKAFRRSITRIPEGCGKASGHEVKELFEGGLQCVETTQRGDRFHVHAHVLTWGIWGKPNRDLLDFLRNHWSNFSPGARVLHIRMLTRRAILEAIKYPLKTGEFDDDGLVSVLTSRVRWVTPFGAAYNAEDRYEETPVPVRRIVRLVSLSEVADNPAWARAIMSRQCYADLILWGDVRRYYRRHGGDLVRAWSQMPIRNLASAWDFGEVPRGWEDSYAKKRPLHEVHR